jgi:hypothetical protein
MDADEEKSAGGSAERLFQAHHQPNMDSDLSLDLVNYTSNTGNKLSEKNLYNSLEAASSAHSPPLV